MPRWTAADIPWDLFEPAALDPDTLRIVKAAALVEFNAEDYSRYLGNVFAGDAGFAALVDEWRREEEQHGRLLGRYAEMADPSFSFARTFDTFRLGYRIPVEAGSSVRGSRTGELLARCIVETGTSSFYSAILDSTAEPVLKALAQRIAADEFRHYGMFRAAMGRYQRIERLSLPRRAAVTIGRLREIDDDELAFAFHCANLQDRPYDREDAAGRYAAAAYRFYRRRHADRATAMILKAAGLPPQGWLGRGLARFTWWRMRSAAQVAAA